MRARMMHPEELDPTFATAWDELVERRGVYADPFDTHAWFASTLHGHHDPLDDIRVVSVLDADDRPRALLPLERVGPDRWGVFAAHRRPRSRIVVHPDEPHAADTIADALARDGVRELRLHRMPSRDPETHRLIAGLRACGYRVSAREKASDMLASVDGGWSGHRARFRGFDRYAQRFATRVRAQWNLTLDTIGTPGTAADHHLDAGFAIYTDLFARSWKGPLENEAANARRDMLTRAAARDWARLYILRVDGVPAAMHLWFRIGDVATWHSTAYDERFASLGIGTVVQWQAQERVLDEPWPAGNRPRLVDLMPTRTPQKLRLAPERPALWDIEAVRDRPVLAVTLPARGFVRATRMSVEQHLRVRRNRSAEPEPLLVAETVVEPAIDPHDDTAPKTKPEPIRAAGTTDNRAIALACGHRGTETVDRGRAEGDTWWVLGERPHTLVHLGADHVVRTVAALGTDRAHPHPWRPVEAVRLVATALGETLRLYTPDPAGSAGTPLHEEPEPVPWPAHVVSKGTAR
ncbi:GNAT family N-acetyltransferase [Streptomyces sp. SID3343]|uniref:GNAT family N-acetyltransferase n=1 Tax=Streptomyces sp. SID3343 TaxID=2690260 RepID=UPI00136D30AC|nr:GNAT family N-acetyltransferase [Streptomyces sp. SID3343]MYV98445.1 GNAT family N-acetyltransferase [Streptomyces sp. SID3343]